MQTQPSPTEDLKKTNLGKIYKFYKSWKIIQRINLTNFFELLDTVFDL